MSVTVVKYIWAIGVVAFAMIRLPHQVRSAKQPIRTSMYDFREKLLLAFLTAAVGVVPAVYVTTGFPQLADYRFVPAAGWIGTAVFLASLWLFYLTHRDLGRGWSSSLDIREGHKLVTTGIYARVRHAMYSAFLLWGLAQTLLLPNFFAGPAGLIGTGALTSFRMRREEEMLLREFADQYRAYMQRTRRLIPWLI